MKNLFYMYVDDGKLPIGKLNEFYTKSFIICHTYHQTVKALDDYTSFSRIYLDLGGSLELVLKVVNYLIDNKIPLYGFEIHLPNKREKREIEDILISNGFHWGYR